MSQRRRRDRLGREIKTQADYARIIISAIVLSVLFVALLAGALWLDKQYNYGKQVTFPAFLLKIIPSAVLPYCMPGMLAGIVFLLLQGLVTTVFSRFYHNPKDELDEDGMYKHRGD